MEDIVKEFLKLDFLMMLIILTVIEIAYVIYRMKSNCSCLSEDNIHHLGSHILLLGSFILTLISYKIFEDLISVCIWGVYALWHLHKESKELSEINPQKNGGA